MTIYIASDHAGFDFKQQLKLQLQQSPLALKIEDLGVHSPERSDYPDQADLLSKKVLKENGMGILICGSGIGVSIRANRFPGIRAALVWDTLSAALARRHNNANVVCLGARLIPLGLAFEIVQTFLNTEFEGGRHEGRVKKIDAPLN